MDNKNLGRRIIGLTSLPLFSLALASAALAGCGGDDDGGMGTTTDAHFSSTLLSSSAIGKLTSEQQVTLCADISRFATGFDSCATETVCRFTAITSAGLASAKTDGDARTACSDGHQQCEQQLAAGTFSSLGCAAAMKRPQCTATVGELTACLNDLAAAMDVTTSPLCDKLTLAQLSEDPLASAVPASCQTVIRTCWSQ
jgi:hypothetical protein